MEDQDIKEKEKRAFWVGLGTIFVIVCLIFAVSGLVFSDNPQPVKKTESSSKSSQDKQKEQPTQKKEETKEPEPASAEEEPAQSDHEPAGQTYEVEAGDTLYGISLKFNVDWQDIAAANSMSQEAILRPGETLIIPQQ